MSTPTRVVLHLQSRPFPFTCEDLEDVNRLQCCSFRGWQAPKISNMWLLVEFLLGPVLGGSVRARVLSHLLPLFYFQKHKRRHGEEAVATLRFFLD